jgi:methionyl-tRNA formyltransferase
MDDPLYTLPFLKDIFFARKDDICGIALVKKGNRVSVQKHQSKFIYLITLLIILGPFLYFENVFKVFKYKTRKKLSQYFKFIQSPSLLKEAENQNIPTFEIQNPNNKAFLSALNEIKPDVIINQSQSIIKKELLTIPKIGVINRHNALLPKNRGRLTPFWVKYKKEKYTGVSIHFLTEEIDAGDIIYQVKFEVKKKDSIRKIVKKNYIVARKAMLIALEKLEKGDKTYIKNDSSKASYNTIPSLRDAIYYRLGKRYNKEYNS